jgi:uracil-DNA glycosylase family 4
VAACLPPRDCGRCPRLADFLRRQREAHPDWFNAPVPPFGPEDARLAIIGLAPGLRGANRTGRPFTGDYAGELLYGMLVSLGLARGHYEARPDDGLELVDTVIINAVRCVPPQNKPTPAEIAACNTFLACEMERRPLRVIVALGRVAHDAVLMAHGLVRARYPFAHGAQHPLPGGRVLIDSYHCSRYNTQTGRLTPAMFAAVLRQARQRLEA